MADRTNAAHTRQGDALTPRQLEILALLAGGLSTPELTKQLGISLGTLKAHLTSIFRKTGTANRVQAARYYLDNMRQVPAAGVKVRVGSASDRDERIADAARRRGQLSRRELQVLEQVAAGETNNAIGRELGLSQSTIKTYVLRIYEKTGSQNRVQAASYYLRHATADAAQHTDLDDDIADIKARLQELQPAVEEARRLQDTLEALQAVRRAF